MSTPMPQNTNPSTAATDLQLAKQQIDARHGRYTAQLPGNPEIAELTFTQRGPDRISADHTGVPDSMAGKGVARALLAFMLEDARASGFRILPLCPYVQAQYARHPEWADLFTTLPGAAASLP